MYQIKELQALNSDIADGHLEDSQIPSFESIWLKAFAYAKGQHKTPIEKDIQALWQVFTKKRSSELQSYFQKPSLRRAYLGYYLPLYAQKMALLLQKLQSEGHLVYSKPISLWDVGCGPLTASLSAYLAFGPLERVFAVDQTLGPAHMARALFSSILPSDAMPQMTLHRAHVLGPFPALKPAFLPDLIVLANVFNELGQDKHAVLKKEKLIHQLVGTLAEGGRLLIVEPSHRLSASGLMQLRDRLSQTNLSVLAPCVGALRCPLLQTKKGWCHMEQPWQMPKPLQDLDRILGLDHRLLKSSYLLLAKAKPQRVSLQKARVVSGPMVNKGNTHHYVCTKEGLVELTQAHSSKTLLPFLRGQMLDRPLASLESVLVKPMKEPIPWQKRLEKRPKSPRPTNYKKPGKKAK